MYIEASVSDHVLRVLERRKKGVTRIKARTNKGYFISCLTASPRNPKQYQKNKMITTYLVIQSRSYNSNTIRTKPFLFYRKYSH